MKLVSVSVRNLKGLSFTFNLTAMNVLIGSNFVGKTARLDAIRLLLLGYFPELGKTARATFDLCSGRDLYVDGTFDNGEKLWRRWYLKGDTVKTEELIPPSLETAGDVVAIMLNAETYLGLSERERVNYVFAHIPNLDIAHDREGIVQAFMGELFSAEGLGEDALRSFSKDFTDAQAPAIVFTPQEFIEWAVDWAHDREKTCKAQSVVMTKTAQGLAYLRTQDATKASELTAIEAEIKKANADLSELRDAKAQKQVESDAAQKAKRRRQILTVELEGRKRALAQRDYAKQKVALFEAELAKIPGLDAAAHDNLRRADREAVLAVSGFERDLRHVNDALESNRKELAELGSKTKCAYCGATGDTWKAIKRAEIESAIAGLKTKGDQIAEHLAKVRQHATQVAGELRRANDAAYVRTSKNEELRTHRDALSSVERTVASTEGKAAELAALPEEDAKAAEDYLKVVQQMNTRLAEITELENKRRAIVGLLHDLKRLAEAEKNRDRANEDAAVAKLAAETLRGMQAKFVAESFSPLLSTANAFFGDVLRSPLAYNAARCELGTWRDGQWVGHKTFSGAERRLAYVAIQAALASRSPFRLMLLDELGTIDVDNVGKVARDIAVALDKSLLDQFVGIDVGRAQLYTTEAELSGTRLTLETISDPLAAISP